MSSDPPNPNDETASQVEPHERGTAIAGLIAKWGDRIPPEDLMSAQHLAETVSLSPTLLSLLMSWNTAGRDSHWPLAATKDWPGSGWLPTLMWLTQGREKAVMQWLATSSDPRAITVHHTLTVLGQEAREIERRGYVVTAAAGGPYKWTNTFLSRFV